MKEHELIVELERKECIIENTRRTYEDCERCIREIKAGSTPYLSTDNGHNVDIPKVLDYMCIATLQRTQDLILERLIEELEEIIAFIKEKHAKKEEQVDEIIANSEDETL